MFRAAVSIPTWSYAPAAADYGGAQKVDKLTSAFNAVAREEAKARDFTWVDIGPASTAQFLKAGRDPVQAGRILAGGRRPTVHGAAGGLCVAENS